MENKEILVSIGLPVYNGEKFIKEILFLRKPAPILN